LLLEREARLLDSCATTTGSALYAAECIYWVPSTPARATRGAKSP